VRVFFYCILMILLPVSVMALTVDTPLADPAQEARAKALFHEIRCASGMSDDEVKTFLVSRYGDFILMSPPFKPTTYLLWFGPLIIFTLACWFMLRFFRKSRA